MKVAVVEALFLLAAVIGAGYRISKIPYADEELQVLVEAESGGKKLPPPGAPQPGTAEFSMALIKDPDHV